MKDFYQIGEGENLAAVVVVEMILIPLVILAIKIRRPHL